LALKTVSAIPGGSQYYGTVMSFGAMLHSRLRMIDVDIEELTNPILARRQLREQ